jgi:hypothetical protein
MTDDDRALEAKAFVAQGKLSLAWATVALMDDVARRRRATTKIEQLCKDQVASRPSRGGGRVRVPEGGKKEWRTST